MLNLLLGAVEQGHLASAAEWMWELGLAHRVPVSEGQGEAREAERWRACAAPAARNLARADFRRDVARTVWERAGEASA